MKLKAFSLLESLVALTVLAFVMVTAIYTIGRLYATSQTDVATVYSSIKEMEVSDTQLSAKEFDGYTVVLEVTSYGNGLDLLSITAVSGSGREIMKIRKLVRHEN